MPQAPVPDSPKHGQKGFENNGKSWCSRYWCST